MTTSMVVNVHAVGGPEQLVVEKQDVGDPGPGEVKFHTTHVGLNFIDCYFRSGLYPLATSPFVPGSEAAGEVVATGGGVDGFRIGDRVACVIPGGAYAEHRIVPADRLVKLPAGISNQAAAALMLKGMTVRYLFKNSYPIRRGQRALFHAAAGGVGLIACQWARHMGITLIGTAGSAEKCERAIAHGATACINYSDSDWVEQVMALTEGQGFPVVYDSVGKATFESSRDCLEKLGTLISYGNASGPVENVNLGILAAKGSLYVQRPTLFAYIGEPQGLAESSADLFDVVLSGAVKPVIGGTVPMSQVADAHRALEARETSGSIILEF